MVVGITDNSARKKLLQTNRLTLRQCIDICRSSETLARQLKAMNQEDVSYAKEKKKKPVGKNKTSPPAKLKHSTSQEAKEWPTSFVSNNTLSQKRTVLHVETCAGLWKPNHFAV